MKKFCDTALIPISGQMHNTFCDFDEPITSSEQQAVKACVNKFSKERL